VTQVEARDEALRNAPDPDGAAAIGNRLRVARRLQRSTLKAVADKAGVSESFLSQIERGRTRGSVASLKRITDALGMTMADLFDQDPRSRPRVLPYGDRPKIDFGENARKFMLTARPLEHIEVFIGEIAPGGSTGAEPFAHGDSEELVLVLRGNVTVEVDGATYDLAQGDSIFYRSSLLHRASNHDDELAEVLWVISPPSY
jgi:transcriptional regulator with XRE-family HTH domain